ncbi:MAG: outer membrane beta-barrel protein [Holosporaceae bacterium]|jgi:hypothetical protein|nr:outer membrane beta-barrel protein [Holosporaceae bacterium]
MKNVFLLVALSGLAACAFADEHNNVSPKKSEKNNIAAEIPTTTDDFLELSEPYRTVGGAYFGVGLALSRITHKLNATKNNSNKINFKNSATQYDLSFIFGFGSAFYKSYYTGIEFSIFKRLSSNTKYADNESIGLKHSSILGLDMDVRLGYLFPESGNLAYFTVGFARVIGRTVFREYSTNRNIRGSARYIEKEKSFGSFYPTFGCGIEHKLNQDWDVRCDLRMSITSKDDNKSHTSGNNDWSYDAKPSRFAIGISITRSII